MMSPFAFAQGDPLVECGGYYRLRGDSGKLSLRAESESVAGQEIGHDFQEFLRSIHVRPMAGIGNSFYLSSGKDLPDERNITVMNVMGSTAANETSGTGKVLLRRDGHR